MLMHVFKHVKGCFSALYDEKSLFPEGIGQGLIVTPKYTAIASFHKIVPKYPILFVYIDVRKCHAVHLIISEHPFHGGN